MFLKMAIRQIVHVQNWRREKRLTENIPKLQKKKHVEVIQNSPIISREKNNLKIGHLQLFSFDLKKVTSFM